MASKPQAKSKSQIPQPSPFEAQLLYQNIDRLQTAMDEAALLAIIAAPGLSAPPTWAALYRFTRADGEAQPTSGEVSAVWPDETVAPLAAGTTLAAAEFPLIAAWLPQPDEPLFIPDIGQQPSLPEPDRWPAYQTAALAILPLSLEGGEVWLASLSWDKAHYFTPLEARIFETLAVLTAPVMISRQQEAALVRLQSQQNTATRRIKALAKTLPQALAVIDSAGRHSYANQAYHDLLGYDFQHRGLVGQPVAVLFPPADSAEPEDAPAARAEALGAGWAGQETLQRRDGSRFEASLIAWTIGDEAGSVAVYIEDLSRTKAAVGWLEIQRRLAQQLNGSDSQTEAMQHCLAGALEVAGLERGRLYLADWQQAQLELVAQQDLPTVLAQQVSLFSTDDAAAEPLLRGVPIYAGYAEVNADPRLAAGDTAARAVAIVPVMEGDAVAAVLHLASASREQISAGGPARLETIANQLGHHLRLRQLEAALEQRQAEAAQQLQTLQNEAQAELQATRAGLEQELAAAKAELETHLETAAATLQTSIEQTQAEAETRVQQAEAEAGTHRQQAQAQLEQLLALTSDWVWRIDTNGQVTASNQRVEAFLGRPVETVVGQSIFELVHPSERSQLHARLMQQMVAQTPDALPGWTDLEISWSHREGFTRRSLSTLRPQFDGQGFLTGFQGIERAAGHFDISASSPDGELDRFKTLAGIAALLEANPSTEASFAELVVFLQTQLGLSHVQIYTFNEATLQLVLHACAGEAAALLHMADHRIPLHHTENLVAQAARHRQVMRVNDARQEANFAVHPFMPDTRSQLSVPLTSGRRLVGVLDLHANQANRFGQADVELFEVLAAYLARFRD